MFGLPRRRALAYGACGVLLILPIGLPLLANSSSAATTSATASPATTTATATGPAPVGDDAYWTGARMLAATPVAKGPRGYHGTTTGAKSKAPAGTPQGKLFAGIAQVGTFFVSTATGNTSCTGSIVHSKNHNLVLTAGHCAYSWTKSSAHRIFVPQYAYGRDAAHQPYGYFPVTSLVLDPRYSPSPAKAAATNLDFAFATLGANTAKRQAEDVAGALTLAATPSYRNTVTVIGYPGSSHNPKRQAITCTIPTDRLTGYRQMRMICGGYFDGVSGSPWIAGYDAKKHTGTVIGAVGGRGGGGNDTDDDWISYSPYYDAELTALYADATAGRKPARTPYKP